MVTALEKMNFPENFLHLAGPEKRFRVDWVLGWLLCARGLFHHFRNDVPHTQTHTHTHTLTDDKLASSNSDDCRGSHVVPSV